MSREHWILDMVAEPIVPAWASSSDCHTNGAELQRAIVKGFSEERDPIHSVQDHAFTFEKVFTFAEHGEFFRGALIMASLRYSGDFYDLLKRYGTIKVTLHKHRKVEESQ
jgi:hypothetical protein